jgi:phosphoribosylamine---glycine ligase
VAPRRFLVVGSGGREHALAWRLAGDPEAPELIVTPGNDGMARRFRRLDVGERDVPGLVRACAEAAVDVVVIGGEGPLADGVADGLTAAGIAVFGPTREAARLEWSKWFGKSLMIGAGIPTARAESFESLAAARAALSRFGPPFVLKCDGLAAGKGVLVTAERDEAEGFLAECLEAGRFGAGGRRMVIEEFLAGEEASLMAVCDGRAFAFLPSARDYKRALDGDLGGNTGGMGGYAPHPAVDRALEEEVGRRVVAPVLAAMERRGAPYRGALYCGLMLGPGGFSVVEFNCRFGDPETELVLPLVDGSLGTLLASAARGALDPAAVARGARATVGVALVDEGYPDRVGGEGAIAGLDSVEDDPALHVFHAACRRERGEWRVGGGRAAHVVATAASREDARARAYRAIGRLSGSGWRCRSDIALEAGAAAGPRGAASSAGFASA